MRNKTYCIFINLILIFSIFISINYVNYNVEATIQHIDNNGILLEKNNISILFQNGSCYNMGYQHGYYLKEMADGMYKYQSEVDSGERVIIGVNKDELTEELPIAVFSVDPEAESKQVERLRRLKSERNSELVADTLQRVRTAAEEKAKRSSTNILVPVLEAVKAYATIGEICGVLREVFGEYKPVNYF